MEAFNPVSLLLLRRFFPFSGCLITVSANFCITASHRDVWTKAAPLESSRTAPACLDSCLLQTVALLYIALQCLVLTVVQYRHCTLQCLVWTCPVRPCAPSLCKSVSEVHCPPDPAVSSEPLAVNLGKAKSLCLEDKQLNFT